MKKKVFRERHAEEKVEEVKPKRTRETKVIIERENIEND